MKRKSAVIPVILAVLSVLTSCGKESDGTGGEFNVTIPHNPQNLDPQLANDKESFYVIKNIYATLMDMDGDGNIIQGAARSYSVSDDGRFYTFRLREGLVWKGLSSEETVPLTAYDYEYAFERIFSPETHSPHTQLFSKIKNSLAYYGGGIDRSKFGVHAESEDTLVIELEEPDCDFLRLMTHPAASPCSEEIFLSTQGRYGLSAEDTYGCGAFYVTDWNYDPYWTDNHITLQKIGDNSKENYVTCPYIINIEITEDKSAFESKINASVDAFATDDIADYNKDISRKYECKEFTDRTSFLVFSPSCPIYSDENGRKALAAAIDRERLRESVGENSEAAGRLFPAAIISGDHSIRKILEDNGSGISFDAPVTAWKKFISEHSDVDFNSYTMLVCDSYNSENVPFSVINDFEEKLDFYCMADFKDESEYSELVNSGRYELCIATVSGSYNMAENFWENIVSASNSAYSGLTLSAAADGEEKIKLAGSIEEAFCENAYAIPLTYEKKYFITANNTSDLWYEPYTDVIYFKYARKAD